MSVAVLMWCDCACAGLACDEDNQPDMSEERVNAWVAQIKGEGMPL